MKFSEIANRLTGISTPAGDSAPRDAGSDVFGARSYSSNFGRFMSADWSDDPEPVPYANLTNPQTLNLYAMVRDNPTTFADLDGHEIGDGDGDGSGGLNSGDDPNDKDPKKKEREEQGQVQCQNATCTKATQTVVVNGNTGSNHYLSGGIMMFAGELGEFVCALDVPCGL